MKRQQGDNKITFPIDLVYLWVDGDDPAWRAKHSHYKQMLDPSAMSAQTMTEARWRNNDELRYSLRSVERYAPWINHIYIVTDNQCPRWLNIQNKKISIIDHSEILPSDALPVFNSTAIECCLYKIPNLSEHFLFANDDMFFSGDVTPEMFFYEDGRTIVRLGRYDRLNLGRRGNYIKKVWRMQDKVYDLTGNMIPYVPHHNIDAYRKSDFRLCLSLYAEQWRQTMYRRFRHDEDMHRSFVGYYAIATGRAVMRRVGRYNRIYGVGEHLRAFFSNRFAADSHRIRVRKTDYDSIIERLNPLMICMNDDEHTSPADCRRMVEFLERFYPVKCAFER